MRGPRGLRARVTLSSAVPLALALVATALAVTAVFSASVVRDLDDQTRTEVDALVALIADDRLPGLLPVPAGSALLAQVVGADGAVLAAGPGTSPVQPLVPDDRTGVRTLEDASYLGVPLRVRVVDATLDGRGVQVVVAAPLSDVRRALVALRLVLLLVVPLLLVAGCAAVWWVTGRALRPVDRLRAAAQAQAREPAAASAPPLPVPAGDDEVARLARTLDELLGAWRGLLAREQGFVADAAHELRAPLTGLRVQLDVAQAHPATVRLPELLADLSAEVARLETLVADLLLLARAEQGGPARRERVDLRALAGADGGPGWVLGDPDALARAVRNLLDNAHRHGTRAEVSVHRLDGQVVLDVDDDGPGIPPADRQRVLERWVRLDPSRAGTTGGSGLGLALVRATARAHGGDVEVLTSPLGGARLRLRLPAAPPD